MNSMDLMKEMKEVIKDMENISFIENCCTALDNIEDGVFCESLLYGEVKKELRGGPKSLEDDNDNNSEDFMLNVEKQLDISKEMELLNIWAEKEREKHGQG